MGSLNKYARSIYSQGGQDGVIEEICRKLRIRKGWFVDVGAWDGKYISNTYNLYKKDWEGVEIEGDEDKFDNLTKNINITERQTFIINEYLGAKELDEWLDIVVGFPKDYDLLNIDIDSWDYWLWKYHVQYSPKIVVIEIDGGYKPGVEFIQPEDRIPVHRKKKHNGASFTSMLKLGHIKGYQLVCQEYNLFFVRNDLVAKLKLPKEELENPDSLFIDYEKVGRTSKK